MLVNVGQGAADVVGAGRGERSEVRPLLGRAAGLLVAVEIAQGGTAGGVVGGGVVAGLSGEFAAQGGDQAGAVLARVAVNDTDSD
ncbi:hypothetical protein GCM10008019_27580 [Deinococcus soli (ex Cha et al. 2016)]|nr:hypothetical protein GCM10008019_27580 [Deinococcus soli (ex Cha et al. 2016)]